MWRRKTIWVVLALFAVLLGFFFGHLISAGASGPKMIWLDRAPVTKALKPSAIPALEEKLFHRFKKIDNWFNKKFWPNVFVDDWHLEISSNFEMRLPANSLTSVNGMRLWILTRADLAKLTNTIWAASRDGERIGVPNKTSVHFEFPFMGIISTYGTPPPMPVYPTKPPASDNRIVGEIKPTAKSGQIKLDGAICSGKQWLGSSNQLTIKTNLFAGFEARLNDGEALLLDTGVKLDGHEKTSWILVVPSKH